MSAKDSGLRFLNDLLAHVPAEKQADVKAAFEASEKAIETLGAGVLARDDYSRSMDQLKTARETTEAWHQQLTDWYAEQQAQKPAAPAAPAAPIQTPAANLLTREDFAKEIAIREQNALAAIVTTNQLSAKHYATFNEVLDIPKLMTDPEINKIGLVGVYEKTTKDRYAELAAKARQAEIEAEVTKRLTEERTKLLGSRLPYPVSGREASPLDAIDTTLTPPVDGKPIAAPTAGQQVLEQAVAQYNAALAATGATA